MVVEFGKCEGCLPNAREVHDRSSNLQLLTREQQRFVNNCWIHVSRLACWPARNKWPRWILATC